MKVPLSRPDIGDAERALVDQVLSTPFLSQGPMLTEFESRLADYVRVRHAVAVSSGTSALHLGMRAIGVKRGDEVVTSPFSFVASANSILFEGGKPIFADIDEATLNMDPAEVERRVKDGTKAILTVDVFGLPADMDPICKLATDRGIPVLEDSCEALGATYKSRKAGSLGTAGAFGFYPNKQITTGEGGALVTDNDTVAELCRSLRNQGRGPTDEWLSHENLGYNYRLDEMSAALGVAQLGRIEEILRKRTRVAETYHRELADVEGVCTLDTPPWARRSWFVYVIRLDEPISRDAVARSLRMQGVECGTYFPAIHLQPFYMRELGFRKGDFPVCERVSRSTLALPFFTSIGDDAIRYVRGALEKAIKEARGQ